MNKRIRQYVGLLSAVLAYYLVHEGSHFVYALSAGVFQRINFMGLGVQIAIESERMSNLQLGIFCLVGAAATAITAAIRLLLDKATTVEEALELLSQYDMHFSIGAAQHLSVSDATGRSVAVEWVNGEMVVTDTPVVTNFYLYQDDGTSGSEQSYVRFDTLTTLRQTADGVMTPDEVRSALAAAAQSNFPGENGGELTCWSWVYNPQERTALFYDTEDWEHPYTLSLRGAEWLSQ